MKLMSDSNDKLVSEGVQFFFSFTSENYNVSELGNIIHSLKRTPAKSHFH